MKHNWELLDQLPAWARLNGVELHGATIAQHISNKDGGSKGGGLVAAGHVDPGQVLLKVPSELVLSREQVEQHAKSDKFLRDVLDAVGPVFNQNSRKAILIFLLLQLAHSSPDFEGDGIGVTVPLTDYVNFLPKIIPLPIFYTSEEQEMLVGTSLEDALHQKMRSLEQEFEHLRVSTQNIEWCNRLWWSQGESQDEFLTIEDWKVCDAMYRSRALELPGVGDAMVPILDMANHSSDKSNARFEVDAEGGVILVARDTAAVAPGAEVTIMYGDGGACEMMFSYGFLEDTASTAREMFLDLKMFPDDPLALAKVRFAKEAPGVRIYSDEEGNVRWESPFAWWACANEEDGLEFRVVQDKDGGRELIATWHDEELRPSDDLSERLSHEPLKDIFKLRVVVLIQERVELQGSKLSESDGRFEEMARVTENGRVHLATEAIRRLRELELQLLMSAYGSLESEKAKLLESDSVRGFLQQNSLHRSEMDEEDFS